MSRDESVETNWDTLSGFTAIQDADVLEAWTADIADEVQRFARTTLGIVAEDIWGNATLEVAERYLIRNETSGDLLREDYIKYLGEGIRRIVDGTWVCLPSVVDAPDKFGVRPRSSWPWQYLIPIAPNLELALDEKSGEVWKTEFESVRNDGAVWGLPRRLAP